MKPLDLRLLQYARAARGYIVFTAIMGVLTTLLIVAQVLLIATILGTVVPGNGEWSDVSGLVVWLGIVFAARVLVLIAQERFAYRSSQAVITQLRSQVLDRAVEQGPRFLDSARGAEVVTLATRGLDDLGPYFERYLPQLLLTVILTPITLIVLTFTDLTSGLILTGAIPLIPVFMWLVGTLTASYSASRLKTMDRLGGQLMDLLAGLATLKAFGRENGPGARVRALADAFNDATMGTLRVAFLSGAILEFFASISVALVAVVAGMSLAQGHLTLTTGLAAIMLAPEVLGPLRAVGLHFHASTNGIEAANAAFEILELPEARRGGVEAPDLSISTIECVDLSIEAPGRDVLAPARLNAQFRPGTVTALIGPSGVGKSSASLAILGLLEPTTGDVQIHPADHVHATSTTSPSGGSTASDGAESVAVTTSVSLSEIDLESWQAQISWVPQRPTILAGTIVQNVTGDFSTDPDVTDTIVRAAELSGLCDVIEQSSDGWQTRIGHGGVGLSVGQRQRLALARALVSSAPLVVLDEPTAHLDAATETEVIRSVEALRDEGRIVIVIAHRPGVTAISDSQVLVTKEVI